MYGCSSLRLVKFRQLSPNSTAATLDRILSEAEGRARAIVIQNVCICILVSQLEVELPGQTALTLVGYIHRRYSSVMLMNTEDAR